MKPQDLNVKENLEAFEAWRNEQIRIAEEKGVMLTLPTVREYVATGQKRKVRADKVGTKTRFNRVINKTSMGAIVDAPKSREAYGRGLSFSLQNPQWLLMLFGVWLREVKEITQSEFIKTEFGFAAHEMGMNVLNVNGATCHVFVKAEPVAWLEALGRQRVKINTGNGVYSLPRYKAEAIRAAKEAIKEGDFAKPLIPWSPSAKRANKKARAKVAAMKAAIKPNVAHKAPHKAPGEASRAWSGANGAVPRPVNARTWDAPAEAEPPAYWAALVGRPMKRAAQPIATYGG